MKYLSIDIEATGLDEQCHIIEYAMVPFDAQTLTLERSLTFHCFVQCPPFEKLRPTLHPWVIEHNQTLIEKANKEGKTLSEFKSQLSQYFSSAKVRQYFNDEKIVLFGKSLNAIDLPFLTRDLGWDFMRQVFHHKTLDLSSFAYGLIDLGILPIGYDSSSQLMKFLQMGPVAHTALEDAINTADMYMKLLSIVKNKISLSTPLSS